MKISAIILFSIVPFFAFSQKTFMFETKTLQLLMYNEGTLRWEPNFTPRPYYATGRLRDREMVLLEPDGNTENMIVNGLSVTSYQDKIVYTGWAKDNTNTECQIVLWDYKNPNVDDILRLIYYPAMSEMKIKIVSYNH